MTRVGDSAAASPGPQPSEPYRKSARNMGMTFVGAIGGGVSLIDIVASVGAPVPEPASVLFSAAGLLALTVWGRRR